MSELDYVVQKYSLDLDVRKMPIEIPNVGRAGLAKLFDELGYRAGVEIGVQQGLYTEVLCKENPQAKIYGIDPWEAYEGYQTYVSQEKRDVFYEEARERLGSYNCQLLKKFSMDALDDFEDGSLDFVFIDGNHDFLHVTQDIAGWSKKVRRGGIISGHDYIRRSPPTDTHVVRVVQAYTYSYRIKPWFVLGTMAKESGVIRDRSRSWMWVN